MNKNVKQILTEDELGIKEDVTDEEALEQANKVGELLDKAINSPFAKLRRFVYRIKRMFKIMFEVGRYDLDWDHSSITDMLIWKLGLMIDFFESENAWSKDAPKVAKEMREARDLLKKYYEYESPEWEDHKEKYGELDFNIDDNSLETNHRKCSTEEQEKEATKESVRIHRKEEEERSEALKKAFYLIGDNIEKWWD